MKVTCIADTHNKHGKLQAIAKCDILICAGDITTNGQINQAHDFIQWFRRQHAKHKIFIAGNHDWCFQHQHFKRTMGNGVVYLEDEAVEIDGIKIYGSPWQPEFCSWAFNLPREGERLARVWANIPTDTDILITHGPPAGKLDKNKHGLPCGCSLLAKRVAEIKPKYHIFGHIHEGAGTICQSGTTYINASRLDENYEILPGIPISFEIKK